MLQTESDSPVSRETGRFIHPDVPSLAVLDLTAEEDEARTIADWTSHHVFWCRHEVRRTVVFRELADHFLEVDLTLAIDDDTNRPVVVVLTEQNDCARTTGHASEVRR